MGLLPDGVRASGSVTVDGHEVVGARDARIRPLRGKTMAMVFQEPMSALDPLMRVGKQLAQAGVRDAATALEEVELDADIASRFPHQLSGGQRQRVNIARALMERPDLLLADEPTSALDSHLSQEIIRLLRDVTQEMNTATVLVTHDRSLLNFADRVVEVKDGHVSEQEKVSALG